MSEVTKKSDTSSSQMRLLGGTPHMYFCGAAIDMCHPGHFYFGESLGRKQTKWAKKKPQV